MYRADKVEERMQLHQVVLDRRPADDERQARRHTAQAPGQLRARVLDLVPLRGEG